jgi:hypothetical protein
MDIPSILKRAAEKGGFERTTYIEKNIPTSMSNVSIMSLFGDLRSSFITSSLILRRYREEMKGSKYFILLSWPGHEIFYPYVNEYWTLREDASLNELRSGASGFENTSRIKTIISRHLNCFFEEHLEANVFNQYYDNGFKKEFFNTFKHIKCFLPSVPSAVAAGVDFVKQLGKISNFTVFVYPTRIIKIKQFGREEIVVIPDEFWLGLFENLIKEGVTPVIYRDFAAYDFSVDLPKCIHYRDWNLGKVLGVMRATGCVLDFFSGISRFAIAARTPYVACDSRSRYSEVKEYEIDDICAPKLPRQCIFGFPTIIKSGEKFVWKQNFYDVIIRRLLDFLSSLDRGTWPSTSESNEVVPYANVRKIKTKKLGTRFIKICKD